MFRVKTLLEGFEALTVCLFHSCGNQKIVSFPAFLWQKTTKLMIKKSYIKMEQQTQKNDSYYKEDN